METGFMNRITGLVIALVVGGLLVGGLLIPSIEGMTATEKTFENEGLWRMAENTNGMVYTHDVSVPEWALNDDVILSGDIVSNNSASNVILGDNWLVRANGWIRGTDLGGNNTSSVTVNIDQDTILLAGAGLAGTTTQPISGYGYSSDGDYLMTAYNSPVYVLGDSPIYATGLTQFTGPVYTVIHIEGTINDGVEITVSAARNNTISDLTISDVVIDAEKVSGYDNLYKLNGITAKVAFTGYADANPPVTVNDTISYSSYVVPYQVTAERTNHMNTTQIAMFGVISILGIVALVVVAANGIRNKY